MSQLKFFAFLCPVLALLAAASGAPAGRFESGFAPAFDGFGLRSVTVQPDGKILCWGRFTRAGSNQTVGGFVRLLPGGALEGTATFNPGTGFNILGGADIETVSLQPDGRILIAGDFTSFNGQPRRHLLRLKSDGGLEGAAGFNPGTGPDFRVRCSAIQRDGKILLAGYFTQFDGQPRGHIARLLPGGELESTTTFDTGEGADNTIHALAIQEDGMILAAGAFDNFNGQPRRGLARLHPDGSLENEATFHPATNPGDAITNLVVTPGGRILIWGYFPGEGEGMPPRFRLAALRPDGTAEGPPTWNPGLGPDNAVHGLTVQADGKILITGLFTRVDGQPRTRLARLLPDGSVESLATFDPGAGLDGPTSGVVLQPDGRIVVTGNFYNVNGSARKWIARFSNDPALERIDVTNYKRITWTRGGGAPEAGGAAFELSTDGGTSWVPLGGGVWDSGAWRWNGTGLPAAGRIRSRGRTDAGLFNGGNSSGMVEVAADFSLQPEIEVGAGPSVLADGQNAAVDFGRQIQGTPGGQGFTVSNTGRFPLVLTVVSVPPGYSLHGLSALPLSVDVESSITFEIRLTTPLAGTHSGGVIIASDDLDEASFEFPVTGEVFIPDPVAMLPTAATLLNPQTGLREQKVSISNDTTATVPACNLIVRGLPAGVELNNASERRVDGSWVVYVRQAMNPRSSQDILLEYFSATRQPVDFTPQLSTEVVLEPVDLSAPDGAAGFAIDRVRLASGGVLIEFPTVPGRRYQVQYSSDGAAWQISQPSIRAAANRTQWLDRGLPRTESHPAGHPSRFYRVAEFAP